MTGTPTDTHHDWVTDTLGFDPRTINRPVDGDADQPGSSPGAVLVANQAGGGGATWNAPFDLGSCDDTADACRNLVDIKTKIIGDQTLLSVKYGSWHGVLLCNFRPRRFAELWRTDERAVDQSLMTSRRGNTGPGSPRRGGSESSEVATTVCSARFAVATPVVQE